MTNDVLYVYSSIGSNVVSND